MKFGFHVDAEAEFNSAIEYYETCREGLGIDFAHEVYTSISRICLYPQAWSSLSPNTRRCFVNRFPFGVIYRTKKDFIQVLAVADLRRKPGYWEIRK